MKHRIIATAIAAGIFVTPLAAVAQQLAPGDGIETYSDTLPKHGATAKKLVALKTSSKKSVSKSHKAGKNHKSGKHHA